MPRWPTLPGDLAVLIIEHDMDLVFRFAHRIVVLADGAVLADGTPDADPPRPGGPLGATWDIDDDGAAASGCTTWSPATARSPC